MYIIFALHFIAALTFPTCLSSAKWFEKAQTLWSLFWHHLVHPWTKAVDVAACMMSKFGIRKLLKKRSTAIRYEPSMSLTGRLRWELVVHSEIFICFVQAFITLLFCILIYFIIGYQADAGKFGIFLVTSIIFQMISETLGTLCAIATRNATNAFMLSSTLLWVSAFFICHSFSLPIFLILRF